MAISGRGKESQTKVGQNRFESGFIRLERDKPKKLKLTNWRHGEWFDRKGIRFDVIEEDSVPKSKIYTVTSRRLLNILEPIVSKADENGEKVISLSITKIGDGFDTSYDVDASDEFRQK